MMIDVDPGKFQPHFGDCEEEEVVMPEGHHIVSVREPETPRTEEVRGEQPDTPAIGRWYWVTTKERDDEGEARDVRRIACVTRLGSNYVRLTFVGSESTVRIHDDEFWSCCEFIEDAQAILRGNAEKARRELDGLMEDVKQLTSKLGVTGNLALGAGEAASTSIALASDVPAAEYKTALVKAKEETLPALFEAIKDKSAEYAMWLSADVIPMHAEAERLEPAIERVEARIFSVELYAGLCEEVEQIKDGEPAALTEPVHLFQRRLYMDEECLANYSTGGMEFKNLRAFERWLCRKDNLDRVLPFPRTVVAFQVRRNRKDREWASLREFVRMMDDEKLDKLTFLYIRNGARVYRLSTALNFGEELFPDLDHPTLAAGEGCLYAKNSFREWHFITEAGYEAMVRREEEEQAEYERRVAEENKKPKKERQHVSSPWRHEGSRDYEPFTKESVHYDDIAKALRAEMEKHNRIVLVLQGLLDRSPALHPHPQWRLFESGGFRQGLALHRDSDRVFVAGDKPDFEAYRARLNASIAVGTVVIGQEDAWERFEARKENARRDSDRRWARTNYRPEKFRPDGDPGPGQFARVARLDRSGHAHFRWTKERSKGDGPPVGRKYGCKVGRLFNVDAYQPGDYKQFFADPRTRAEYLGWAPFLLAAEEYKAGRFGEVAPIVETPKPVQREPSYGLSDYARRKMLKALLGKAVRLRRAITTRGGDKYEKGSLWRVVGLERGETFDIWGIDKAGEVERVKKGEESKAGGVGSVIRSIHCVSRHDFEVDLETPIDPTWQPKPEKCKTIGNTDSEED